MSGVVYTQKRTLYGKKGTWVASLGEFDGKGDTKTAAKTALFTAIDAYKLPTDIHVLQYRSTTGIVYRCGHGWAYQIIPHSTADNSRACTCLGTRESTAHDMESALRMHLAQWHMDLSNEDTASDILLPDQISAHLDYCAAVQENHEGKTEGRNR